MEVTTHASGGCIPGVGGWVMQARRAPNTLVQVVGDDPDPYVRKRGSLGSHRLRLCGAGCRSRAA